MLIDSNVLVYSLNTSSPKCQIARNFLQANIGKFWVAQQNVLETIRIVTHTRFPYPMNPLDAVSSLNNIVSAGFLINPTYDTLSIACELIKKHQFSGPRIFDAYLVATMISNNLDTIVTDNESDFAKFNGIKVINPFK